MDKKLIKQTAISLKETRATTTDIIDFYSQFIRDTIASGQLENVMIPQFGKFKVNMKRIKYQVLVAPLPKTKIVRRAGAKPIPKNYKKNV